MPQQKRTSENGISRRTFLGYSAGAGMLLGSGALLALRTDAHDERRDDDERRRRGRRTERRTYLFNLSHVDTSAHHLYLVVGSRRVKLRRTTPKMRRKARRAHPILAVVPDEHLTHHLEDVALPADAHQLCFLQRVHRKARDGSWDLALVFHHHPIAALQHAHARARTLAGNDHPPVPVKFARYGLTPAAHAALSTPLGAATLQDATSQAESMVAGHPELMSLEPTSAAHIQTNIIGTLSQTQQLATVITSQGPATTTGGWATQTPLINPDTGQPAVNSSGQTQYIAVWSPTTAHFAGLAIQPALDAVKNDATLGVNVTAIDPTSIATNDPAAPTHGKLWMVHDGMPAVQEAGPAPLPQAGGPTFALRNKSPNYGYSVAVTNFVARR
jgi:hypothetical protein